MLPLSLLHLVFYLPLNAVTSSISKGLVPSLLRILEELIALGLPKLLYNVTHVPHGSLFSFPLFGCDCYFHFTLTRC